MNRVLVTTGQGHFVEQEWDNPPITANQITVRSIMTGVCRSDIDMMEGNFGPLPVHMQGHEGLGQVIAVTPDITNTKIGDIVATRGEPAYADVYNVRYGEYVVVPEAAPKYILEPVACGVNVVRQADDAIRKRSGAGKRLLILGSGFLAWVAYHTVKLSKMDFAIDVVGNANKDMWGDILRDKVNGTYDVIIDLCSHNTLFEGDPIYNENALIVFGAQKEVKTDFANMLWKAVTMVFPSPRNPDFKDCMYAAAFWVKNGDINVDNFWTKGYNRDTEWQQAFADGTTRIPGYKRGYIYWNN